MKVFHILNHFLPNQVAGTEIYTWALCKQLQQSGVDIKVVIPNYGSYKEETYIYDDIDVYQYPEPSFVDRSLIMGFREAEGLINFEKYILDQRPDIIHFHELAGSNGITLKHLYVANNIGAKVLMTFHLAGYSCKTSTLVDYEKKICNGRIDLTKCSNCYLQAKGYKKMASSLSFISSFLHNSSINTTRFQNKVGTALGTVSLISKLKNDFNLLVSQCDIIVSLTDWYEKILITNGVEKSKIKVIKQGIPFETNKSFQSKINHGAPLRLIFLGRINKHKGLHLLIEAIREIDARFIQLSIFGHSDDLVYESSLKNITAANTNILWKGNLSQNDVVSTFQKHDVLCLCSTFSEMSPLVIQEAFAAGIPVIASNVYGNAEQIQHDKNGLLFEFNNVEHLRKQILRCITEPGIINKFSKNITPPTSFKDIANQYIEIYKTLLN